MNYKNISLILILVLTLFGPSLIFSQDAVTDEDPVVTEESTTDTAIDADTAVTEEKAADEKTEEAAPEETKEKAPEYASVKAAVYDDGLATYINSRVKYEITASDNALTDKSFYKVDEGQETLFEAPFALQKEGKNVVAYYSVDKMGNREKDRILEVVVDNTPPVTTVKSSKPVYKSGEKLFISSDYLFSITSQDSSSGAGTIEYSLDGQSYKGYESSFSAVGMEEATMKVRSADNVTNTTEDFTLILNGTETEPVTVKGNSVGLTLDNMAPAVEIKADAELKQENNRNIASALTKYEIAAKDDGAGVAAIYFKIDKAEKWVPYTKAIEFSIFGEHRIEAMAVDNVGNASEPVSLTIFIDTVPPEVKETVAE